ncbi:arginine methyl transferase [Coprinellus micaceus]|uniref:Arginine methyl transferase n=1 Tax=Coprinellus micaceus TaxID=71717 RepID=A0A4Y7TVN7_COPMI|nr:arginine methyl transferase [Coprinellus micaceus]
MDEGDIAIMLGSQLIQTILNSAPFDEIKDLVKKTGAPVWYQDEVEGMSPLHAAAYVRRPDVAKFLIQEGAVWNAVDNLKNTAGDIALSFNDEETYTLIRDAGIRSEMLLGILASQNKPQPDSSSDPLDTSTSNVVQHTDDTAAGSTSAFLDSKLVYTVDEHGQSICKVKVKAQVPKLIIGEDGSEEKEEEIGTGIMKETVRKLTEGHPNEKEGLKVLNVGFGLGIIDTLFESLPTPPSQHVIIEPHPDVLAHMRATGWYDRPNVTILEGKWQDFVGPTSNHKSLEFGGFDVVYTDTFSEDYSALKEFFEQLPDILDGPGARFGFFNGLGATNALFYDVYTHISELHLADIGLDVEWSDVDVSTDDGEDRWGQSREYFNLPIYRLPVARMRDMSL